MASLHQLEELARLVRYYILVATTEAGSGHPSSSLSATDLMVGLVFGGVFRFDLQRPDYRSNDRLIFSKGHASPLLYALYAAAGSVSEVELKRLRKFDSPLEGHPTPAFPYTEAATGSLGQGLSIGIGLALNAKLIDHLPYRSYVLLGDSELAEGSVWEAIQIAAYYRLDNLIGILDVNRLGQRGQTMYGHDLKAYDRRIQAFGWATLTIDGHSFPEILKAYQSALTIKGRPVMIIAKTLKGKGVSLLQDQEGWHGKTLPADQLDAALKELGKVDKLVRGEIAKPDSAGISNFQIPNSKQFPNPKLPTLSYPSSQPVATRKAYGNALVRIFPKFPTLVVLDAEVSNSTHAEIFKKAYPERFFEMFIAEQNMVGVALGLSRRGKIPFVSTFAAFLTRAFDQIRMSQYSKANIKFVGSHAGVSIGEDGASQMGLEDIAMFRTLLDSVVLYPADAVSTEKLVEAAAEHLGNVYLRTTRKETPLLYQADEPFPIGGSKIVRSSRHDLVTVIAAGITLFEALKAYEELKSDGIAVRVIDLYCLKPIGVETLRQAAKQTKAIITVEDHLAQGGLGEAVMSALANSPTPIYQLAVRKMPKSGQPEELLDYEEIACSAIVKKIKEVLP